MTVRRTSYYKKGGLTPRAAIYYSSSPQSWIRSAEKLLAVVALFREDVDRAATWMYEKGTTLSFAPEDYRSPMMEAFQLAGPIKMLYGMSLENLFKAKYIADHGGLGIPPKWWGNHDLSKFALEAGWDLTLLTEDEVWLLESLSDHVQLGRYPLNNTKHTSSNATFMSGTSPSGGHTSYGPNTGKQIDALFDRIFAELKTVDTTGPPF